MSKKCEKCGCPTDFDERIHCPLCGQPYGDPEISAVLMEMQRDKTDDQLISDMAAGDFAAAQEYARRHLR